MFLITPTPRITSSDEFGVKTIPNGTAENPMATRLIKWSVSYWLVMATTSKHRFSRFVHRCLKCTGPHGALFVLPARKKGSSWHPLTAASSARRLATPPHCISNSWVPVNTNRMRAFNGSRVEQFPSTPAETPPDASPRFSLLSEGSAAAASPGMHRSYGSRDTTVSARIPRILS